MSTIRKIYLYLFSFVGLVLVVIGLVQLVNLALTAWVFKAADQYYAYPEAPAPAATPAGNASGTATAATPVGPTDAQMQAYQAEQTTSDHERTAAEALAMIIIGAPLYWYHWRTIKKEKEG